LRREHIAYGVYKVIGEHLVHKFKRKKLYFHNINYLKIFKKLGILMKTFYKNKESVYKTS